MELRCIKDCLSCPLRSKGFFCDLRDESLEAFNRIKHAALYPKGAVIFLEGEKPRGVYMLCRGQARYSANGRDGKTFTLRMAEVGDVLGLHATVSGGAHEMTVETTQPCQLNYVGREDFLAFLTSHSDACLHAAQRISRDYQRVCAQIRSVRLAESISERLAKFLLESSAEGQVAGNGVRTRMPLTHEGIGQRIGASRETITRTLSEFRRMEVVELKGPWMVIHNQAALQRLGSPHG